MIQVTVWNEYRHERTNPAASEVYPNGIHTALASKLQDEYGLAVQTATLDEPEHGLTVDVLNHTDVLIWWGHIAHDEVDDAIVNLKSFVLSPMRSIGQDLGGEPSPNTVMFPFLWNLYRKTHNQTAA